ncbi:hypothetical protein D8674_039618 [Pyrus ussuriensis x Pyrus communis]|uniref:RNase H type-1 domain-containing protein n=1 Tax=Pyrus ussuriensis x Pyrus communis TaxID=2448454 RepID=A0A5N5H285_9ROSA|nr:hypothetical protein D8674_039618 [Pyrus ussuriensis x Pyrus communis]
MQRIWKCCNDMVFKGVSANPMEMINIEAINGGVVFGGTTCFAGQQVWWKRPAFGVLWGLVWVDLQGRLWMAAGGEGGLIFNNPMMVEVAAVRAALQVCLELGCIEVGVESDSQTVIRMANREFLASQLGRVTFACVKRHGNAAAHAIASYVTSHGGAFR